MFLPNPPRRPYVDDGLPGPQRDFRSVYEALGGGPDGGEGEEEEEEEEEENDDDNNKGRTFFPESWAFTLLRTDG